MYQILQTFRRCNDSELVTKSNDVSGGLKTNVATFTDTTHAQLIDKCLGEFQVAMSDASDGGRIMLSVKRDKRKALEGALSKAILYVLQVCNNDRTLLLSSGFELRKQKGTARSLAAIESMVVTSEKPGEASINVNKVAGARAYVYQYTAEPLSDTTVWVSETSVYRQHTFAGLKQYGVYHFRIIAIGSYGMSVISDPVTRVIS